MNYAYKDYKAIIQSAVLNHLGKEESKPAPSEKKSVEVLAKEVIQGVWSNGEERKKRLTDAGYDYTAVNQRSMKCYLVKSRLMPSQRKLFVVIGVTDKNEKTNSQKPVMTIFQYKKGSMNS